MSTPPTGRPDGSASSERDKAAQAAQEKEAQRAFNTAEADSAWRSVAYLLSGPLVYGLLGFGADQLFGTDFLVGVGIVGGMALSLYLIWFRYGTHGPDRPS